MFLMEENIIKISVRLYLIKDSGISLSLSLFRSLSLNLKIEWKKIIKV